MFMNPLLFGVNVSTSASEGADPVGDAQHAEALGFDFISSNDHPCGTQATYEVWTMLTWIAASTSRIKIATRVLGMPFRPPPMVAKMAASFDQLSQGRLILGLGGGASDAEFHAFGLGEFTPRQKMQGLEEAIRVIRGLWSDRAFTFEGELFHTDGAEVEPKPQRRIPIWLGTYGHRGLEMAGRLGDGWIPTLELAPPERVPAMRDRVLAGASDVGRASEEITCVYNLDVRVGNSDGSSHVLTGGPDAIADRLKRFVKLGFSAFNFAPAGPDVREQVERLGREVLPALRS
jgi:probable F420-dependent oxidoreductase